MHGILLQIALQIRLNFRNRMALLYQFLFPTIFLIAFRTLYRGERVPLALHAGEILTVTILGSTCFGLPVGIVSDRERGVWRRYKMLPVSAFGILGGTLITRYLLVLTAGLVQLALAMLIGMPLPAHPVAMWLAFSLGAIAFMGIGLDISMLGTDVPSVQALGQCVFLPMVIVGGVAVPLANLPSWAQHISAFLPGRYSVEVIQACVTGTGLDASQFDILLLAIIGATGFIAGLLAFRWDNRQRPSRWIALALAGWVIAGMAAESHGIVHTETVQREELHQPSAYLTPPSPSTPAVAPAAAATDRKATSPKPAPQKKLNVPSNWEDVTQQDIAGVAFDLLPPDTGVVAPIAGDDEVPDGPTIGQLEQVRAALPNWAPGKIADPVQRVRNLLYAASVCDVYRQFPLEKFVPAVVFEQVEAASAASDLPKILYFIATHPQGGAESAGAELHLLGLPDAPTDMRHMRDRNMLYAFKLLGRLTAPPDRK